MNNLKMKDIFFGKVDAYREYLEYGKDVFMRMYFPDAFLNVDKLTSGDKCFVCGDKGTGKTMLLQYLFSSVENSEDLVYASFTRFKRDVDDATRIAMKRASIPDNPFENIVDKSMENSTQISCVLAWQVYLIKTIVKRLELTESGVFERCNDDWLKLRMLINAMYKDESRSRIKQIIPKLKDGNIEVNIADKLKANINVEWVNKDKTAATFRSIAKEVVDIFSRQKVTPGTVCLFIDELELSPRSSEKYGRDIALIRDLIIAVQYLHDFCIENYFGVRFIVAIRNEVCQAIQGIGYEVNKITRDLGLHLSWITHGGDLKSSAIMKMLEYRILESERKHKIENKGDVWYRYFSYLRDSVSWIYNLTWSRPRDLILLFSIIQERFPESTYVDKSIMDSIIKEYATEEWKEISEEMSVRYSPEQIEGIRLSLLGIKVPFTIEEYKSEIDKKSAMYTNVKFLTDVECMYKVIADLYDFGVIGNYSEKPRFAFKGDQDIDPTQPISVHNPLRSFFRTRIYY